MKKQITVVSPFDGKAIVKNKKIKLGQFVYARKDGTFTNNKNKSIGTIGKCTKRLDNKHIEVKLK